MTSENDDTFERLMRAIQFAGTANRELGFINIAWADWYTFLLETVDKVTGNSEFAVLIAGILAPGGATIVDKYNNSIKNRLED